ncbi:MAG: ribosome-associated translation inhibitor RaiA [Oscillospiraceae bacterium]|jgi:putative sigma-54 modulation protein|nr:ribosome-associated translation inhibitor RaiA [Oscillospiraceae bacterium]
MEINIISRKTQMNEVFKERIDKKLNKLAIFFKGTAVVNIVVTEEGTQKVVELTIKVGNLILRAQKVTTDFIESFDLAFSAIIKQLHKNKTKLEKRIELSACNQYKKWLSQEDAEEQEDLEFNVAKKKKFFVETMEVQEAILQMNLMAHKFYIFADIETNKVNVVYKRYDGAYGLIEPEISN